MASGKLGKRKWLLVGIAISVAVSMVFTAFYDTFRNRSIAYVTDPTANHENISWLYETGFLLYRDLYNTVNGSQADYQDIYFEMPDDYAWLLDEETLSEYIEWCEHSGNYDEERTDMTVPDEVASIMQTDTSDSSVQNHDMSLETATNVLSDWEMVRNYYTNLQQSNDDLSRYYDYCLTDHSTGKMVTNMAIGDVDNRDDRKFFVSFVFDSAGNVSIGEEVYANDEDYIRRVANSIVRGNVNPIKGHLGTVTHYAKVMMPTNCTIAFSISEDTWNSMGGGFHVNNNGNGLYSIYRNADSNLRYAYTQAGVGTVATICFLLLGVLGIIYAIKAPMKFWRDYRHCAISAELLVAGGFLWWLLGSNGMVRWVSYVAEKTARNTIAENLHIWPSGAEMIVSGTNLLFVGFFFLGGWYLGICLAAVVELGVREYIRQRSVIYRIFPYTKKKIVGVYERVANLDLTKNAHKTIIQLLIVNGIILFLICSLWVAGWAVVIIYSLLLYVVMRKYISDLQKRYSILFKATNEIAKGNLNVSIDENLGVFEPFKPEFSKIQEIFKNAVEEEVKSQRMKTELITNVSHDLKTPLTAIITYINLLKDEKITEQQRREYLDTLERKSLRLKVLIEDLFEISKANSNNVTLNIMDVDIMNLVKQVSFEMGDKLDAAGLDVRLNLPEGKIMLPLDSQKTYRVYENLFGNVAKYAMPGTRVYVSGALLEDCVEIIIKNITAQEITVNSEELTERFVRGDAARNTEGSGLGLAIAKSFMELQGGELKLEVDGDLFKATTLWKLKINQ